MERNSATNREFAIWVSSYSETPEGGLLAGVKFDGEYGLGADNTQTYAGPITILTRNKTDSCNVEITFGLVEGRGFTWLAKGLQSPKSQFLITNNPQLRWIFSGMVKIRFSEGRPHIPIGQQHLSSIRGKDWFGVLEIKRSFLRCSCKCIAFSTNPNLTMCFPQEVNNAKSGVSVGVMESGVQTE